MAFKINLSALGKCRAEIAATKHAALYGSSPAMAVLGDVKKLNSIMARCLRPRLNIRLLLANGTLRTRPLSALT